MSATRNDSRAHGNTYNRRSRFQLKNVHMTLATSRLTDDALDLIFRKARTQNGWQDRPVTDAQLQELYELMKWGPTTMNSSPARIVFLRTTQAKERLKPALSPGNTAKTMQAPVTAIIAHDTHFYDQLPKLFPHRPNAKDAFSPADKQASNETIAFRNGTLQGAYFIIAARSLGLECGPMSGFDNAKVDAEFFAGTHVKSNFICSLGYGDPAKVMGRLPRLSFDEACTLL
jgi:3-hydroxypropanoate dehydrogenase